ncbi:ethanolamine utilization protein EutJ [Neobacillus niacini]|uniref:ethanolamine utilization protein EutJ n=1 Tax=Neobacillus niacini TaxID=86668 RepID=UPI00203F55CD|nr:ethanolamine utilization protein EutJ [Neobacillus niacini]MCM3691890.1 ethanolamine utilization protein EutJ [Neobacillus niacini]
MQQSVDGLIKDLETKILTEKIDPAFDLKAGLKVGVDLGTSNIVIVVLDKNDQPVTGAMESAKVVRDGIVVDFIGAVKIVSRLKLKLEQRLGIKLEEAATAIPPGILKGNIKVITNVVEAAGFRVTNVVEEPVAAARVLNITDGAVVDMGGGTTGISVLKNGEILYSVDEPTGGTHLTLVLSGSLQVDYDEAEKFKQQPENYRLVFPIVRPVIEKMAEITKRNIIKDVMQIYLVGGTACLDGIEEVFQKYTSIYTTKPYNPLLVTPLGIAMYAK